MLLPERPVAGTSGPGSPSPKASQETPLSKSLSCGKVCTGRKCLGPRAFTWSLHAELPRAAAEGPADRPSSRPTASPQPGDRPAGWRHPTPRHGTGASPNGPQRPWWWQQGTRLPVPAVPAQGSLTPKAPSGAPGSGARGPAGSASGVGRALPGLLGSSGTQGCGKTASVSVVTKPCDQKREVLRLHWTEEGIREGTLGALPR